MTFQRTWERGALPPPKTAIDPRVREVLDRMAKQTKIIEQMEWMANRGLLQSVHVNRRMVAEYRYEALRPRLTAAVRATLRSGAAPMKRAKVLDGE